MKYSAATNGFYDALSPNVPTDAVEISDQTYAELMQGQSIDKQIQPGPNGFPILVERPKPTVDERKQRCKKLARMKLEETDYTQTADVAADLLNVDEFVAYRSVIRGLFFAPIPDPVWPAVPEPKWRTE